MERRSYNGIIYFGAWLSLLTGFLTDKMLVQSVTVEAHPGDSVVLPCSANRYQKNAFWRHDNADSVYDIIEGKVNFHDQHAVFRGRVEGFPSEFANGNYSIRLKDVKYTDSGTYSCQIPNADTQYVELQVKERVMRTRQHRTALTSGEVRRRHADISVFSVFGPFGITLVTCLSFLSVFNVLFRI